MISFIRALFGGDGPKSGHYVLYSFQFIYAEIGYSDRAVYSDLNPLDGGQSLYPMSTVLKIFRMIPNKKPTALKGGPCSVLTNLCITYSRRIPAESSRDSV